LLKRRLPIFGRYRDSEPDGGPSEKLSGKHWAKIPCARTNF